MSPEPGVLEIDCYAVLRKLSNYLESDLTAELRAQTAHHLLHCAHCLAVFDGMRNVVRLLGRDSAIELPNGLS